MNIFQMMQNPAAFMSQLMQNSAVMRNPMARNVLEMYQKQDTDGLKAMTENMCRENGTTVEEMRKKLEKRFGIR